jgi:hypothetical protein
MQNPKQVTDFNVIITTLYEVKSESKDSEY